MPIDPGTASLIGSGLSTGLGIFNSRNNMDMQRETNELNYKMFREAQEYDKPVNQVARLKEAGLNPALMYGTGSGANTAPSRPTMEAPKSDYRIDPGIVVQFQQARLLGEQAKLAAEQARGVKLENNVLAKSPGSLKHDGPLSRGIREVWSDVKEPVGKGLKWLFDPLNSKAPERAGKMSLTTAPAWMKEFQSRGAERAGGKF